MAERQNKILIVDDDELITDFLSEILSEENYRVAVAHRGTKAIQLSIDQTFDLFILDAKMPEMDGFETCRALRANPDTQNTPVIFITGASDRETKLKALGVGANDFLSKPVDLIELKLQVRNMIKINEYSKLLKNYNVILEKEVNRKTDALNKAFDELRTTHQKIKDGYIDTVYRLTIAAEYKDACTATHLKRISRLSAFLAENLGLNQTHIENISIASPMHDIGKIGIPDTILLKPGKLTAEEFKVMQNHTVLGQKILEGSESEIIQTAERMVVATPVSSEAKTFPW
jgi:putative two-component system response regulator